MFSTDPLFDNFAVSIPLLIAIRKSVPVMNAPSGPIRRR
jgi:hypothetical protein